MASLTVRIGRDIPHPAFEITLPNNHTEELDAEELREWFRIRGADELAVEKAMDYVWNMGNYKPVYLVIENYREPVIRYDDSASPRI